MNFRKYIFLCVILFIPEWWEGGGPCGFQPIGPRETLDSPLFSATFARRKVTFESLLAKNVRTDVTARTSKVDHLITPEPTANSLRFELFYIHFIRKGARTVSLIK